MAQPRGCSVDFLGFSFQAFAVHMGLAHAEDHEKFLPPAVGRPFADFRIYADMHDPVNASYDMLSKFMDACLHVTEENTDEAKVYLWADENQSDALITFSFQAWVAAVSCGSLVPPDALRVSSAPTDFNHVLSLRLEPIVDEQHGINIVTGN